MNIEYYLKKIVKLIEAQKDRGLTINAFCKKHQIPISTIWYWRKQFSGKTKNKGSTFVKVLPVSIMQPSAIEVKIGPAFR